MVMMKSVTHVGTGLLAYEASGSRNAAVCAMGIMAVVPAHLMRSVAGEFDNDEECEACYFPGDLTLGTAVCDRYEDACHAACDGGADAHSHTDSHAEEEEDRYELVTPAYVDRPEHSDYVRAHLRRIRRNVRGAHGIADDSSAHFRERGGRRVCTFIAGVGGYRFGPSERVTFFF